MLGSRVQQVMTVRTRLEAFDFEVGYMCVSRNVCGHCNSECSSELLRTAFYHMHMVQKRVRVHACASKLGRAAPVLYDALALHIALASQKWS